MNNSRNFTHDPVYQSILQTHTDSLKRYLSLAPTLKTPPQRQRKHGTHPSLHSKSFEQNK